MRNVFIILMVLLLPLGNTLAYPEIECIADNIWFESLHEPMDGKRATAFVTMNRVSDVKYPNNACDVVYQKNSRACQFSWTCDDKSDIIDKDSEQYNKIYAIAMDVYFGYGVLDDPTNGALYYHANYITPKWNFSKLHHLINIGTHKYYDRN